MTALVVDGLRRRRECGIGERTHGNGNRIRLPLWFPKYCRTAIRAKVKIYCEPTVGVPSKGSKDAIRFNLHTGKKSGYAVGTACALLAIQTMTQRNFQRIAGTRDAELLTSAGRGSRHHGPSPDWVGATGYSFPRVSKGSGWEQLNVSIFLPGLPESGPPSARFMSTPKKKRSSCSRSVSRTEEVSPVHSSQGQPRLQSGGCSLASHKRVAP